MSRLGYVLFIISILALTGYVFWPEPTKDKDPLENLWDVPPAPPINGRIQRGDLIQEVRGNVVRIHGFDRVIDTERRDELWKGIRSLRAPRSRMQHQIDESALSAYGIDGTQRVDADTLALRWGNKDGVTYAWEGRSRRLCPLSNDTAKSLYQACDRLDQRALLPLIGGLSAATCGPLNLVWQNDAWRDQAKPERPIFTRRVLRVLELLRDTNLTDFTATPALGVLPAIGGMTLTMADGSRHRFDICAAGTTGRIQVDALPAQTLDALTLAAWRMALDDFAYDMPCDLLSHAADSPLGEVHVTRGKTRLFSLEKHGTQDVTREGLSQWDVSWPGGREAAADDAAATLAQLCDRLRLTNTVPRHDEEEPANALAYEFLFTVQHDRVRIALVPRNGAWEVWTRDVRGMAVDPSPRLTSPSADACLDTALSVRPAYRVSKMQRILHVDGRAEGEVFVNNGGGWQRSWPKELLNDSVNQLAIDRLVSALCSAHGRSARILPSDDPARKAPPALEITVRFAHRTARKSDDAIRLADTADLDWSVRFVRDHNQWQAIDSEAGVAWVVDDDLLQILQQPLRESVVFPIIPAVIRALDITGPQGSYRLSKQFDARGQEQWTITVRSAAGIKTAPADGTEVRRYLRTLTDLRAKRSDPTATNLGTVVGSVVCELPEIGDDRAQSTLIIGEARGDEQAVSATSSRVDRHRGNGVAWIATSDALPLLPSAEHFISTGSSP